jgi:hypothetical protein
MGRFRKAGFPVHMKIHAPKGAQLLLVYVNLIIVRFSVEAGRACCDDSVEPQAPLWGNSGH